MSVRLPSAIAILAAVTVSATSPAAESRPAQRPALVTSGTEAPAGKEGKGKPALTIDPRFAALARGDSPERHTAFADLVSRAHELAAPAKAEAQRLSALPEVEKAPYRSMVDWVIGCLEDLGAEVEAVRTWKKGLSKEADAVSGRKVELTCNESPAAEVLRRASTGWGTTFELSPAAKRLNFSLVMSLDGAPSLTEFVDWLASDRGLICGHAGGKLLLVPSCSAQLAEKLQKAAAGAAPPAKCP